MAVQASGTGSGTKLLITGGSHTFQFSNETPTSVGTSGYSAALERLLNHICEQAFHNSDECDEIKCHPGTRTAILKTLFDFANDTEHPFITWLNGPAGAGKTAIAHSLAEQCEEAGILAACFFFWRTDPGRSDEKRLISTLAYQLCLTIPPLRPFIEQKIADDPAIFSKTLKRQLYALILAPLQQMRESHPTFVVQTSARLIIIDGLDECGGLNADRIDRQGRVLEILRQLASHQEVFPFRVLIISRTEAHIRRRFDEPSLQSLTRPLILDYSFTPEQDILVYVTHEFLWIVGHHPYGRFLPSGWPGNQIIRSIVDKSSGQFFYAVTVMKFIRSELHQPDTRLSLMLVPGNNTDNSASVSHFAPIDNLYRQIFCCAIDPSAVLKLLAFHLVHSIPFRWHITLQVSIALPTLLAFARGVGVKYYNPPDLTMESFEKFLKLDPGVITHSASHFESLFRVSSAFTIASKQPYERFVNFHHASFTDFLLDKARSQEWFIDLNEHSIAFAMAHLAELENTETEPTARKTWFIMFCAALRRSPRTPDLDSVLSDKWLRPSQYSPGRRLFEGCGLQVTDYLFIFEDSASQYYRNTNMTPTVIRRSILTDILTIMEPIIQAYRSNPILFALFLYSLHNRFEGILDIPSSYHFLRDNSVQRWFVRYIQSTPLLAEVDCNALQLTHHMKADGEGYLYKSHPLTENKFWLYTCSNALVDNGIYVPPDDDLLKQSTILILEIFLREVAELLELAQSGIESDDRQIRPEDTNVARYLAKCSHLPRSGLPQNAFTELELNTYAEMQISTFQT
ncbi:hypothetical protein BJ165DRAFT_1523987 [Panaeolus papilionaceus]|nr:hypothetical protein BJ165DRAFT_1523987 [Panaeolus papilionaceus]